MGDFAPAFDYAERVPKKGSDPIANLETKIDMVFAEVRDLRAETGAVRNDLGTEIKAVRAENQQLRADVEAAFGAMERRLTRSIAAELAHGLGVIEERFANLFGLLDEKYGGAVGELRRDLDGHRLDPSIHFPRG